MDGFVSDARENTTAISKPAPKGLFKHLRQHWRNGGEQRASAIAAEEAARNKVNDLASDPRFGKALDVAARNGLHEVAEGYGVDVESFSMRYEDERQETRAIARSLRKAKTEALELNDGDDDNDGLLDTTAMRDHRALREKAIQPAMDVIYAQEDLITAAKEAHARTVADQKSANNGLGNAALDEVDAAAHYTKRGLKVAAVGGATAGAFVVGIAASVVTAIATPFVGAYLAFKKTSEIQITRKDPRTQARQATPDGPSS